MPTAARRAPTAAQKPAEPPPEPTRPARPPRTRKPPASPADPFDGRKFAVAVGPDAVAAIVDGIMSQVAARWDEHDRLRADDRLRASAGQCEPLTAGYVHRDEPLPPIDFDYAAGGTISGSHLITPPVTAVGERAPAEGTIAWQLGMLSDRMTDVDTAITTLTRMLIPILPYDRPDTDSDPASDHVNGDESPTGNSLRLLTHTAHTQQARIIALIRDLNL